MKDKIVQVIFLILIVLMTASIIRNMGRVLAIRKETEKEKQKLVKIETENQRIKDEIAKAQSPEFIERQVRDKLGLARIGETIVIVPDVESVKKLAPSINIEEDSLPDPIWRKWLKLFL